MELFDAIARMGSGTVESIEVKHGLPFLMNLEEAVGA